MYVTLTTLKLSSCPHPHPELPQNPPGGNAFQTCYLTFTASFLQVFELQEVEGQKATHLLGIKPESHQGSPNNQVLSSP